MDRTLSLSKKGVIIGMPLLILGMMVCLVNTSFFSEQTSKLSVGITFDLLLTMPLVYFLLIRKTSIPKTTIVPVIILGMVVGSIILPVQNQYYLNLFKTWIFPVIELSIISFVIYKVHKAIKHFKRYSIESVDFFETMKITCYEILPQKMVAPVVMEIAVFYYGFIDWKKRKLEENEFTYHKNSGTITLLVAIILIVAIETVVLHILLLKWSALAAWILTGLSIYSGIQLFGFLRSMYKRPISIKKDKLFLRYGIMNETTIDLNHIDRIEVSSKDLDWNKESRKLSFLGELESHNYIIYLKKEYTLIGLYGVKRSYKNLAFYVDNTMAFKKKIDEAMNQYVL
ncbi:hypothetical protein [Algibacter mikhailovii]|uniref:Beta-carotene 15,15'-monooxygenase n=1 Tax=Algibacter mikhailovii TaxID=425498 RepID=A0A918QRU8_9FLAO|nr:hypothetical protein [Algibacter mikhailovii]GGZ69966.1 hypothetical protein GCM10007028_03840 [Algibacter mikhailovii]